MGEAADRDIQVPHQAPLAVITQHALDPEERGQPRAGGDGGDLVQAGARVQHHVARRQFHPLVAVGVFDHQLATLVLIRVAQEQRGRQVGAHRLRLAGGGVVVAHGVVHMEPEGLPRLIAVEQRRENATRQRRREERAVAAECIEDGRADRTRGRIGLGQLQVVLGLRGLVTRGQAAVGPAGRGQLLAGLGDLLGGEDVGNVQQHGGLQPLPHERAGGGVSLRT